MTGFSPRILFAPDKFKGCLSAHEVAQAMREGLLRVWPQAKTTICPVADGGEGTTEALVAGLNGEWREVMVVDALGRPLVSRFGMVQWQGTKTAVMEMSEASGLAKVLDLPRNPWSASTFGTGQLIRAAVESGAETIILGIGGSATNDGGMGMAEALGYQFLDEHDQPIQDVPANFDRVHRIVEPNHFWPKVIVACDVTNPLLGPQGCIPVYGPQKGVKPEEIPRFEARLERLADLIVRDMKHGQEWRNQPGAGAAGGLGFGLLSFAGAELRPGFELIADIIGLEQLVLGSDLVITGEGRLDSQTLCGKGPHGVALMAKRLGKPVAGFGGIVEHPLPEGLRTDFDYTAALCPPDMPCTEAIRQGMTLIRDRIEVFTPELLKLIEGNGHVSGELRVES